MAKRITPKEELSDLPEFAPDLSGMEPLDLANAIHSRFGPRIQEKISVEEVLELIPTLQLSDGSPSRQAPRLLINRLRFKGKKTIPGLPENIDYDQAFAPGVNVIMSEKNMVGKSTILKTIKFALTGNNGDYDKDVKEWIKEIWLEFFLDKRKFTIILAVIDGQWHGLIANCHEGGSLEEVLNTSAREDQHLIGLEAIQGALDQFFSREYSLATLGWTQERSGSQIIECSTSWRTYFQAMQIKDDDHKYLICEPVPGLANQENLLFMVFLGLHMTEPLNRLAVERSTLTKTKKLGEKDVGPLQEEKKELEAERKVAVTRLNEICKAQAQRKEDFRKGNLAAELTETEDEQFQTSGELSAHKLKEQQLAIEAKQARAQARRIKAYIDLQREFTGLEVTLCPRCAQPIASENIEKEAETCQCRLCNRIAAEATEEGIEKLKIEAEDYDAEAKRIEVLRRKVNNEITANTAREAELKSRAESLRKSLADGVGAIYPMESEEAEKKGLNENLGAIRHKIWLIDQDLQEISEGGEAAEKKASVIEKVRKVLRDEAETRNESINERLKEMTKAITTAIGARNITGISCSPLGDVTLFKNEDKVTFGGFKNPGERFRVKLAVYLAMMRMARGKGRGRHPGFLMIDQLGTAEIVSENLRASATTLNIIDEKFSDQLQIICCTVRTEFEKATAPEKICREMVKTGKDKYAF